MNLRTLVVRSLRFHWRSHLGVVLGAAVATTVLVGALVVGDSVRWSLRRMALARLGRTEVALVAPERFFRDALAAELSAAIPAPAAAVLQVRGMAARADGRARVNQVQVLGVDERFWKMGDARPLLPDDTQDVAAVNERTARALGVKQGDTIVVRAEKPSAVSLDAPLSGEADASVAMRVRVSAIVPDDELGRFSLAANQVPPHNVFMPMRRLQQELDLKNAANVLLVGGGPDGPVTAAKADKALRQQWQLADAELALKPLARGDAGVATISGMLATPGGMPRPLLPGHVLTGGTSMPTQKRRGHATPPEKIATPGDAVELRTSRVFLDPPVVRAAAEADPAAVGVLTYLVNELRVGERTTPYSMVTAIGPLGAGNSTSQDELIAGLLPPAMADDEVIINEWLAEDLRAKVGDELTLVYFVPGPMRKLETRSSTFRIRAVVAIEGAAADKTFMPDFPGLSDVDNCRDWEPGIPIDLDKIRDKDQAYWEEHRGTPKAFVTLAAGQRMWANRFGDLTAVRFPGMSEADARGAILSRLDPAALGFYFQPVRERALAASGEALDFGQLFLGLSFFLIVAALVLTGLLFAFGAEQRAEETGTLLAVGFPPKRVRRLMLAEGGALTLIGAACGTVGGVVYTRLVLYGLATVWQSAVGASDLVFHARPLTLVVGAAAGVLVALGTVWLTLRRQARAPARELLTSGADAQLSVALPPRARVWLGVSVAAVCAVAAAVLLLAMGSAEGQAAAGVFFGAGALLLVAGLGVSHAVLSALARASGATGLTTGGLGLRNATRRRGRSLATVSLVAFGAFLVIAVGANRRPPIEDPGLASSGTGGFRLFGQTSLPVHYDLLSKDGLKQYALPDDLPEKIDSIVPMRVHEGDDASCLNLNRVQRPRLVGVRPEALAERRSFTFAATVEHPKDESPWMLLGRRDEDDVVAAIGDVATIQWSLGKKVGDEIPYTDGRGRAMRLRIVGALAGSILQGSLVISEAAFIERFPSESGYRMFLIDTPADSAEEVSGVLSRQLADVGLAVTPAADRLAEFHAMQNTYLAIFQTLGGLGLVLGSVGLGVVVLRNVLERRGELALMRAVGFRTRSLDWLVLAEHWGLLALGLVCGGASALLAVAPAIGSAGAAVPYLPLAATLAAVAASGVLWTWLATRLALRGPLLAALRNE